MFGFRGLNDDFFGDDSFHPFGFNLLTNGGQGQGQGQGQNRRQNQNNTISHYNPFDMFGQMESMMNQMTSSFATNMMDGPNCSVQSYSYSCTDDGNGPVVVEKQYSHQKMGDISETKASVRDGRKKEEKMRLQRTLGDKARTVTKTRINNGDIINDEIYENIDQNEVEDFDRNWRSKAQNQLYIAQGQRSNQNYNRGLPAPQLPSTTHSKDIRLERTPPKDRKTNSNVPQSRRNTGNNHNSVSSTSGRPSDRGRRGK